LSSVLHGIWRIPPDKGTLEERMQRKRHDLIIGLFVLVAIVTTGILIVKFGGVKKHGRYYNLTVLFGTAAALMEDAPVFYAGVECGNVQKIYPVSKDHRKVRVVLRIKQETVIRKEDTITISTISLLGDKIIKITPGDIEQPSLQPDSITEGKDPVEIGDIFTPDLQNDIQSVVKGLADLVNQENRELFSKTIKNLYLASIGLSEDLDNLREILSADTRISIKNIIANFEKASGNLPLLMEQLTMFLSENTSHVEDLIVSLRKSSDDVSKFISSLQTLVRDISNPDGTVGRLIHSRDLYDNVISIVEGIKLYGLLGFQKVLHEKEVEERKGRGPWRR
jgi:phospholipid/cholesterol/gamma-HCH transport system substrate-binding protein